FFQAEDGIRDFHVTGVQTCALPIFNRDPVRVDLGFTVLDTYLGAALLFALLAGALLAGLVLMVEVVWPRRRRHAATAEAAPTERSEERRVGKEGGARGSTER